MAKTTKKPANSQEKQIAPLSPSVRERDALQLYLKEASNYPLLDPEEEQKLARLVYHHQDSAAAQKLAQANLRFVIKIAMEYARYAQRTLDLIQEGNIGLIHAIREFNPYKEVRLTTYAVWWIRSYIQDYLMRNWSVVRIGTTKAQKKLFYRLKKAQQELEREGITPFPKAIAHTLDVSEKDVELMQTRMAAKDVSLSAPIKSSSGETEVSDFVNRIADQGSNAPDQLLEQEQADLFKKALEEFQDELEDRDKIFFKERLLSDNPPTLSALGEKFGFSKERARQIEERLKIKLKDFLLKYYPDVKVQ